MLPRIRGIRTRLACLLFPLLRAALPAFRSLLLVGLLFSSLLASLLLLLSLLLLSLLLLTLFLLTLLLLSLLLLSLILAVLGVLLSLLSRLLFGKALLRLFEVVSRFRIFTPCKSRLIGIDRLEISTRLETGVSEVMQGVRNKFRRGGRTRGNAFEFCGGFIETPRVIGDDPEIVGDPGLRGGVEPGALERRGGLFETAGAKCRKPLIHVSASPALGDSGDDEVHNNKSNIYYIMIFFIYHSRFSQ